jgi:hypothetical protein
MKNGGVKEETKEQKECQKKEEQKECQKKKNSIKVMFRPFPISRRKAQFSFCEGYKTGRQDPALLWAFLLYATTCCEANAYARNASAPVEQHRATLLGECIHGALGPGGGEEK